jgi:hypothetical protein
MGARMKEFTPVKLKSFLLWCKNQGIRRIAIQGVEVEFGETQKVIYDQPIPVMPQKTPEEIAKEEDIDLYWSAG